MRSSGYSLTEKYRYLLSPKDKKARLCFTTNHRAVFPEVFWPFGLGEIQLQVIALTDGYKAEVDPSFQENLPV